VDSGREEPLADHRDAEGHLGGDELLEDDRGHRDPVEQLVLGLAEHPRFAPVVLGGREGLADDVAETDAVDEGAGLPGVARDHGPGDLESGGRAAGSCQVFIIDSLTERGGLTQVIGRASQNPVIAS
jgi:hypothetical protein